jgi:DedD protein
MAQDNLQPQTDQELEFKKRARRRLVGAIALVLLMIIVLPMILQDRTAQAPKQDVVVSIPSQDQGLNQPPESQSSEAQTPIAEVTPAPIQQAAPESAPVEQKVVETSVPVAVNDKPISPVESLKKTETPKQELANASETKTSGSYFVQIGVFSDPDNVKQMQDKLSEKGLKTRVESIDTAKGKKTRLRVGPFGDKKEAEAALEKVKSLSLTGMIVSAS